jgi:hypothetical protein
MKTEVCSVRVMGLIPSRKIHPGTTLRWHEDGRLRIKDAKMADNSEEPGGGMVADGDFAAATGPDPRARIRHRLFSHVWNSHRFVRSGRGCTATERTGNPGGKLSGNAPAVNADAAVCTLGWLDVFIATAVHAGRRGNACAGGVAGNCRPDGFVAYAGVDPGVAAGSGAGEGTRRIRFRVEGYLT